MIEAETTTVDLGVLSVGDKVQWRGNFGDAPQQPATVTGITVGGKDGEPVEKVEWSKVKDRNVVLDLDTGNWAYGYQVGRL